MLGIGTKPLTLPTPGAEPALDPPPPGARRILVVDDDPVVRKATEIKLRNHRYAVLTACDGPSAIQAVRTEKPDLILLDLSFPPDVTVTWDGLGILSWIHRMDSAKGVPVFIVTSERSADLEQRALAGGASGFYQKPVNYEALLALIELRLKARQVAEN